MAKKLKISAKLSMSKIAKEIQSLFVKHLGKKIHIKEIKAMLVYLLENYGAVSYKKNVLTIRTEDVYRHGYNIGPFDIILDLTRLKRGAAGRDCHYYVLKLSPTRHNHIYSSGGLCFGAGWAVSNKCITEGRLDDFVDVIQQILRT